MASELRSVTATTAHALKQKIMEYITEGWQPYGRILNAGATSVGIIMAKGTDANITDVDVITADSRASLVSKINSSIENGFEMFGEQEVNTSRFIAFMTKGSQGSSGGGGVVSPDQLDLRVTKETKAIKVTLVGEDLLAHLFLLAPPAHLDLKV